MQVTKFNEKLNCLENNIYTIEEVLSPVDGAIDVALKHDNVIKDSVNVYSGSKLTGDKINTYVLSTPSATPWRTLIKIYTNLDKVYVTYETKGDTVEAEDVNGLQIALNETQTALNAEYDRATNRENTIESNLNKEITRATSAEKVITDNLNAEITRSTNKDNEIVKNLNNEISRATNKENSLSNSLDAEIKRATAKESAIDTELSNRYTKDQVYTKDEVLTKINDLINNAPDVLDTFGEIAKALGNDPNFATTMTTMLSQKVDKISGKGLSTNDFTDDYKNQLIDSNNKKHEHSNKSIIDSITSALITNWNNAFNHISDTIKHITSAERSLWNTVSNKLDKSGGTITGKLQNNSYISFGANEQDNHNKNNIKLYEGVNNNGIEYGMKLWNTNGTSGEWSTMIYGPKQANRRISFGKINNDTPTTNSHITEGAYFDLDNWNFYNTGDIYSNGNKVYHQGNKPKLSELTNDAGFITKSEVDVSQNHTHANKSVLDKITSNDVDKIQNLNVGGRNLFVNCGQYTKNNPLIIESSKTDGYNETHNIYTSIELTAGTYIIQAKTDGTWTNSHITTGNDPSKKLVAFWLYRRVNGSATGHMLISMVGNPTKITISTTGTYYLRTNLYSDGTTNVKVNLWDIKLEKATIPTDWTPAPEDMVQKGCTWNDLRGV